MQGLKRVWRKRFGKLRIPGLKLRSPDIKKRRLFILPVLAALFILTLIMYLKITPLIGELAAVSARNVVTAAINEAVMSRMSSGDLDYTKIVKLEKDQSGSVSALITDMAMVNTLKAVLSQDILTAINKAKSTKIGIPVGSLINANLLSGWGPDINVEILTVSSVSTDFSNRFSSAGINQTRHQIMIDVDVSITVLVPGKDLNTEISTQLTAAETVIIGSVPNSYLHFENPNLE